MTMARCKFRKILLAASCVTMLGVPVYSEHDSEPVPVLLRDLDVDANLSTDVPATGELQIKHGNAKVKADGIVSNLSLRKVEFRGMSGAQFGIPPEFISDYKVGKDGKAQLRAEGLLIVLPPPPPPIL